MTDIAVYSGWYDFSDPVYRLNDIAHSLSQICRFNGHTQRFYSVAEHSVNVSAVCEHLWGKRLAYYGLLHDATEAYISDLPRPVKAMFPEIKKLEKEIWESMLEFFGLEKLSDADAKKIVLADDMVLRIEAISLMQTHSWAYDLPNLNDMTDEDIVIISCHNPKWAEHIFLSTYQRLSSVL